jgi:hypothetical protein
MAFSFDLFSTRRLIEQTMGQLSSSIVIEVMGWRAELAMAFGYET